MISVLVVASDVSMAPVLAQDAVAAGFAVVGQPSTWRSLVHDAHRWSPTVILGWAAAGDAEVFQATTLLASSRPTAFLLFTPDVGAERMAQALRSGVHAYVMNGYTAQRLRPLVQLSLARFEREVEQQAALEDLARRFEERKLVDRAKGILMRSQQISEDEAFRLLRQASQAGNQRVGMVSQHVIAAAQDAEWVNLAGRLRMLSQRLVKQSALGLDGPDDPAAQAMLTTSVGQVEDIIQLLQQRLSRPSFGDLLEGVTAAWAPLKAAVLQRARVESLLALDDLAEAFHHRADSLTTQLEHHNVTPRLHVINVAGRQRMRSQRLAKEALLMGLLTGRAEQQRFCRAAGETMSAYEQALADLRRMPLSTPELVQLFADAEHDWQELLAGAQSAATRAGRQRVGQSSESLLQRLEQITAQYERSMQMLMG